MLDDWRTAPIEEHLRATLGLIEKVTLEPTAVSPDDVDAVRAWGVTDEAIEDALHVCALFNVLVRIADALDFDLPSAGEFERQAGLLVSRGYLWRAPGTVMPAQDAAAIEPVA